MTRSELERALVRATGESRGAIRHFGFSLLPEDPEPATEPLLVVDCPGCGLRLQVDTSNPLRSFIECPRCDAVYPYAAEELYVADGGERPLAACA